MKDGAKIGIQCGTAAGKQRCLVTVTEGRSETRHSVTVDDEYRKSLAGDTVPLDDLVRQSFRFLLEREPKESILREFDLSVISRYFPEYEKTIRTMLSESKRD